MRPIHQVLAAAALCLSLGACNCSGDGGPDGGMGGGGGTAGGSAGGGSAGGGSAGGGSAGGGAGGGSAGGGTGGGSAGGGSAGGGAGGGGPVQFTQFARNLINSDTTGSTLPRQAAEFATLPDDMPITFPAAFFDGGM